LFGHINHTQKKAEEGQTGTWHGKGNKQSKSNAKPKVVLTLHEVD
jgi:hypothetical protein